jgi:hypothetical protein
MDTYPEIDSFLESFGLSMGDLKDSFVTAGITTKADLIKIANWNAPQILGYFRNHFHMDGKCEPLKSFPAYALYMRLAHESCVCGRCEDLLPNKRMCSGEPFCAICLIFESYCSTVVDGAINRTGQMISMVPSTRPSRRKRKAN